MQFQFALLSRQNQEQKPMEGKKPNTHYNF